MAIIFYGMCLFVRGVFRDCAGIDILFIYRVLLYYFLGYLFTIKHGRFLPLSCVGRPFAGRLFSGRLFSGRLFSGCPVLDGA
jgi:hypothetical protein